MADKFNGFSQDEINKLTGVKQNNRRNIEAAKQALRNQPGIRRMPDKIFRQADQLRKQQQEQQLPQVTALNNKPKTPETQPTQALKATEAVDVRKEESIDLDGELSESLVNALYYGPFRPPQTNNSVSATQTTKSADNESTDDSSILKINSDIMTSDDDASILPSIENPTGDKLNTDSPFKGISLKEFEVHRKMIEEQNKQKKQMLYQAIEQHTQKTAAESRKIEEIRYELSKLESDLALDVALLRKQIDNACIHFANVEKQYIKVEAQFLKAKMDLHNASEKKELLTEHLCTVIAHNEDRKAQKLTELMQKVGLAPTEEAEQPIDIPQS